MRLCCYGILSFESARKIQTDQDKESDKMRRDDYDFRDTSRRVKKHRQNYLPVLIAVVLIIIVLAVSLLNGFFDEFIPQSSTKDADLNSLFGITQQSNAAIIFNKNLSEEKGLTVNGAIFIPMTMANSLEDIFYYDSFENRLFATTPTAVNEASPSDFALNGDAVYISPGFIRRFANFSYEEASSPSRIFIQTVWGQKNTANATKKAYLRVAEDNKSDVVKKLEEGETVEIISSNTAFSKCLTKDCLLGYVDNKHLADHAQSAEVPITDVPPMVYPPSPMQGNIVLGWHNVTNDTANTMLSDVLGRTHGMNVISPTWFSVQDSSGNVSSLASQSYVDEAHSAGLKIWGLLDNFTPEADIEAVLSHTSTRLNLENNIVNLALQYGLDGINIDFEQLPTQAGDDFMQFLRELSIICHSHGLVLSSDNYVPKEYTTYYRRDIQGKVCDYVIIMGYDEHTPASGEAGSVASIGFVTEGIVNTLKDVPPEKVINGIPFYTRKWAMENGVLSSTALTMPDAAAFLADNGQTAVWDDATCQNYASFEKNGVAYSIWLEDAQSISAKLSVMKNNNLAGVACWRLMMETEDIWDVINAFYPISPAGEAPADGTVQ